VGGRGRPPSGQACRAMRRNCDWAHVRFGLIRNAGLVMRRGPSPAITVTPALRMAAPVWRGHPAGWIAVCRSHARASRHGVVPALAAKGQHSQTCPPAGAPLARAAGPPSVALAQEARNTAAMRLMIPRLARYLKVIRANEYAKRIDVEEAQHRKQGPEKNTARPAAPATGSAKAQAHSSRDAQRIEYCHQTVWLISQADNEDQAAGRRACSGKTRSPVRQSGSARMTVKANSAPSAPMSRCSPPRE